MQFLQTKKKLMLIQNGTTLLFMLTKPHTMTIMPSNRSTWVNGNVVCRSLSFLILPITRSTRIRTIESCLDVSTSPPESCFFAPSAPNSSFISKPQSASIQTPMETLLKKLDSFVICLSDTLPSHSKDKKLIAPPGVIPIKYFEVLLCSYIIWPYLYSCCKVFSSFNKYFTAIYDAHTIFKILFKTTR